MPTVTLALENPDDLVSFGPTLGVRIGFDPEYRTSQPDFPALPNVLRPALLDTGASESCIDSSLALELGLPIVDRRTVSGVHGPLDVNMHAAQICIPSLNATVSGQFAGVHLTAGGQVHLALIGRSFLRHFTMTYEGRTGEVVLSND